MIGRLKKALGIDGLKIEIISADTFDDKKRLVDGEIALISKYDIEIEYVELRFIEIYTRGRFGSKKTDEYTIGTLKTAFGMQIKENKLIAIPFKMPVDYLKSSMDQFGSKNILFKGIARSAKLLKGVNSKYRIEAEAKVKGSSIKPFSKKNVKVV